MSDASGAARADWSGLLAGLRHDPEDPITLVMPLQSSPAGGSGTFLGVDVDSRRWWIKPLNNLQHPLVTVTEHLVARAGALVGAPVCEAEIIRIPPELAGWEFRPGATLEPGLAHGSLAVDPAVEEHALTFRDRDDNARRHAGVFALYDWCWGADDQWLYDEGDERKVYSHDHGWYLPAEGPTWDEQTLLARIDESHLPAYPTGGLDAGELIELARRLEALVTEDLVGVLKGVPSSWPVDDEDLEALGFFLLRRAPAVAARLRGITGGAP